MNKSVTQEHPYGCGIACFAFMCDLTYKQAAKFLGPKQANSNRLIIKHFVEELNRFGRNYTVKHIRRNERIEYKEGMIVLLRRSKQFPVGHYLARHNNRWMDPRINLIVDRQNMNPQSGFRKRLPGRPMYVLYELS